MGKRSGKRNQGYVDHPRRISQLTCLVHDPGYSSNKFKLINNFGTKYTQSETFKERIQDPSDTKKVGKKKEVKFYSPTCS